MGKRYQLTTRMLRDDYRLASIALRRYAALIERSEKAFGILIAASPAIEAHRRNQRTKVKVARLLANRFRTRADRMAISVTDSTIMRLYENALCNRFKV